MKKLSIEVKYQYDLEIDENNSIVKEYESENKLLLDAASYRFGTMLPVIIKGGLVIKDVTLLEIS